MRISELKKLLKGCVAVVSVGTSRNTGTFQASVAFRVGHGTGDLRFFVEAQANDLLDAAHAGGTLTSTREPAASFRSFPAVGPWYAVRIETEERYGYSGDQAKDSVKARAFFGLVSKIVEDRNLQYRFPECELSQVLAAVETLGVTIEDVTVDGQDFVTWRRARAERIGSEK